MTPLPEDEARAAPPPRLFVAVEARQAGSPSRPGVRPRGDGARGQKKSVAPRLVTPMTVSVEGAP
jgi:hypothetical protein